MKCRIKDGEVICRKVTYNLSKVSREGNEDAESKKNGAIRMSIEEEGRGIAKDALVC